MLPRLLIALGVLGLTSGCQGYMLRMATTSNEERTASMALVEGLEIDGLPAEEYLRQSHGVLIMGPEEIVLRARPDNPGRYGFDFSVEHFKIGSLTAIDRRGYFLTAAHVFDPDLPAHALYWDGEDFNLHPVRLVWLGDVTPGNIDLAVLAVTEPLNHALDWAEVPEMGERVLGLGPTSFDPNSATETVRINLDPAVFAGTFTEAIANETTPPSWTVNHTAPTRQGDSGGPLLDSAGRLIGIETGVELTVKPYAPWTLWEPIITRKALRPDVDWLRGVIDEDYRENDQ